MTGRTASTTQTRYPWRSTLRTIFQAAVGLAGMWFLIVQTLGMDPNTPWVATSLVITGGITKVMAMPAVEAWLQTYVPFLSAKPKSTE